LCKGQRVTVLQLPAPAVAIVNSAELNDSPVASPVAAIWSPD
jgi:hypothetical protein